MADNKKPSQEQLEALGKQCTSIFNKIGTMFQYHNNRMNFFKKWNLSLKIIDAFVGVGGLVLIGLYPDRIVSFVVAGIAVFLLFLTVILDFSKKEETHRWLVSVYINFDKTIIHFNIADWENISDKKYKKYKNILFDISETVSKVRKEEFPILDFLVFITDNFQARGRGESVPIICHIKWWQYILANYFSMPNSLVKSVEKFNAKQREKRKEQQQQQQQQEQQQQEPNKGNEENPS